ncbi:hypothetical protein OCS_00685 [Ophiocordyceps sinensis CO18]|uniref:Rhodopsin domain-containing protein n=1 Tax=Ophiocordyceps sinensis (strain Co18 / CGMCC 3.14243) TaxID=911162 RepID=T5ADT1_OPHSC|nr:hypothetical protein OCS_00685 [Ophiocordyceps sinensis CO18]
MATNSSVDLCKVPAAPAPPGLQSNFDNPTTLAPVLMAVMIILVVWAVSFTAARFYINIRRLKLADYFNLLALVLLVAILGIQGTQLKVARHIWDVPACYFDADYARGIYIPAVLLQSGAFFAKASIFLLFHQLFAIKTSAKTAIRLGQTFNFLLYATGIAVATYYETPRAGEQWTAILDGRALIPLPWWETQSALSVLLDLYIFILPLPIIVGLRLSAKQRLSLIAVFSLALMGIGASIASLVERVKIVDSMDQTWISAILALCTFCEVSVAIIVSSAPAVSTFTRSHLVEMPVFILLSRIFTSTSKSRAGDSDVELASDNKFRLPSEDAPNSRGNDQLPRYQHVKDTAALKSWNTGNQRSAM